MKTCTFLTLEEPGGFFIDDALAHAPLAELGWQVTDLPWRQTEVPWGEFDAVVIRSPWDYWDDAAAFMAVLEDIDRSPARLGNPLSVVRWNVEKTYLRQLEGMGVPIVPTLWGNAVGPDDFAGFMEALASDEVVIKPVVGANGDDAYRVPRGADAARLQHVCGRHDGRDFMVQPFLTSILSEGEYSFFYFNGAYSHAILKTPKAGEFLCQEEHGSSLSSIQATGLLRERADQAMAAVNQVAGETLLYARIDLIRDSKGDFRLMEAELIEPGLYLRMDEGAPMRFARAVDEWFEGA